MSEGTLVSIAGQLASWCVGSLINWLKSRRLNPTIKHNIGAARIVPVMVLVDVTVWVEPKPTVDWFLSPTMGPNMMMVCGEGGSKSDEQLDEPEEESVWGIGG